jgi:hypothetical protein
VIFGVCLTVSVAQDQHCTLEDLTEPGDANRDFEFDPNDLIQVMRIGKFETGEFAGWEEGDWNGDGVFDEGDMWWFDINARKWIKTCSLTDGQ